MMIGDDSWIWVVELAPNALTAARMSAGETQMDLISSVAMAAGLAWASGLRLYAVLFLAGLLGRFGYVDLPQDLQMLTHWTVIGASGFMFFVEFFADKVPALDSLWDALHTFIRVPAGAFLAAMALGNHDPAIMVAGAILGGTLAAGTHLAKAGSRALINTSPEPFTNVTASLSEDVLALGGLYAAFHHPWLFLALLLGFVVLAIWLLPRVWRGIRQIQERVTTVFRRGTEVRG